MLAVVGTYSPRVEYYRINEFFIEAMPTRRRATLHETAVAIPDKITGSVRLPVTIGVASTRTLAKLFSDMANPLAQGQARRPGLVVRTREGEPVVFLVCEPATRYYRVMTRCVGMPAFVGEVI